MGLLLLFGENCGPKTGLSRNDFEKPEMECSAALSASTGQLGVPVYRLCLSSPRLSDDRLAQFLGIEAWRLLHNDNPYMDN